ncbi:MAG: 30S ribosomal protein S6 [Verrucomicrobia bacterium]|nr:30S ribosomal protein S6 [Verrucomicrobiota bacterium]
MKIYDAMFIFATSLDQPELDKCTESIHAEIERQGGRLVESQVVGRRTFARPMKKAHEGSYVRMRIEMDPAGVSDFTNRLKLNTQIFRAQILVSDGQPFVKPRKSYVEDGASEGRRGGVAVASGAAEEPRDG